MAWQTAGMYPRDREFLLGLYNIGEDVCLLPPHDQPISANMAAYAKSFKRSEGLMRDLALIIFESTPC